MNFIEFVSLFSMHQSVKSVEILCQSPLFLIRAGQICRKKYEKQGVINGIPRFIHNLDRKFKKLRI